MAEVSEENCGPLGIGCGIKNFVGGTVEGVAGDAMESIADAVTTALIATIAQLGTLWTTIDAGDLTTEATGTAEAPAGGAFNEQVGTILGYATWIGLGISTIAIILLGITLVMNARRGDGAGLVNTATIVFGGAALIGGATSLVGYIVPQRAASSAPAVGFVQDQTFYLTLGLAVLSMIVAGARMVWSQRAEPAQDLLKGLLTLAIVTASGVALLNVLLGATDALAEQIISQGIGDDFESDVQQLLGFVDTGVVGDNVFLGGEIMLVIVGGLVAIIINIVQIMLMVLRTAMLFLIAGVLPLSAAFMNTETGKTWFSKIIAWTLAFAFYKPAAALIYATGIQMTTSGLFSGQALLQFSAGLMLILASVVALPVLIGFLSPALGAMASSGGGGGAAMGFAAVGAAIPQGASRTPRGGQGFGSQAPPQGPAAKSGTSSTSASAPKGGGAGSGDGAAPKGADVTGGGSKAVPIGSATSATAGAGSTAGAGAGAGAAAGGGAAAGAAAAAPPVAAAMVAGQAIKKGGEAVQGAVQEGVQTGSGGGQGGGQGGSSSLPKTAPPSAAQSGAKPSAQGAIPPQTTGSPAGPAGARGAGPKGASGAAGPAGAVLSQGAAQVQKQAQQLKNEVANTTSNTGNEDRTDGANRS
ncbi:hypothetical protein [Arthrobacter pityocampae]|uniref:hypothetical protein n=1 Tax=Arthrobacter pityocampae TaxID=547334 RepID=UPI003736306B